MDLDEFQMAADGFMRMQKNFKSICSLGLDKPKGFRWKKKESYGFKVRQVQTDSNGFRWVEMNSFVADGFMGMVNYALYHMYDFRWIQLGIDRFRWLQIGSDRLRWI